MHYAKTESPLFWNFHLIKLQYLYTTDLIIYNKK